MRKAALDTDIVSKLVKGKKSGVQAGLKHAMRNLQIQNRSSPRRRRAPQAHLGAILLAAAALVSSACSNPHDQGAQPPASALGTSRSAAPTPPSPSPAPAPRQGVLRPNDLLDAPASFLGRKVEVAIVEPLAGPETTAALAKVEYGQIRVQIPDNLGIDFALVPGAFKKEDPNRYRTKFDRVITGPILARGVFESDEDLAKSLRHPAYVLRISSIEPLPVEAPVVAKGVSDLEAHRADWDRRAIVYEGVWTTGFEVSSLDGAIWLTPARGVIESGAAPPRQGGRTKERVRVTGFLFARPSALYGHMGSGRFELLASRIEHLGAP